MSEGFKSIFEDVREGDLEFKESIKRLEEKSKTEERLKELQEELETLREVIKEFLLSDVVPKEDLVTKILEEVFERSFDLKGSVKVVLSPSDIDRAFDFIAGLKEQLGGKVDIEVIKDKSLKAGEIRIETPKFVIERKHEEIMEEIFREVLGHALEGS